MTGSTADILLAVLRATQAELHRQSAHAATEITLDSRLERDLGFNSLARVEWPLRVERVFGATLQRAETLRGPGPDIAALWRAGHRCRPLEVAGA